MTFSLPKIYPITDTKRSGLSHLEQVSRLAEGGARFVQLRDKDSLPRKFYEDALSVVRFARPLGIKIVINDRVDIAMAVGADGVHLGQDDLPIGHARKSLGASAIIGFSTHSLEQAVIASRLPLDYIAIGPVFSTSTKENPDPVIGLATVTQVRAVSNLPIVAIGGIDRTNYKSVLEAGADSVAIISDLYKNPDEIASLYLHLSSP